MNDGRRMAGRGWNGGMRPQRGIHKLSIALILRSIVSSMEPIPTYRSLNRLQNCRIESVQRHLTESHRDMIAYLA